MGSVLQTRVYLEWEQERSNPLFLATEFSKARKVLESCLGGAQWADGGNAQAVQLPPDCSDGWGLRRTYQEQPDTWGASEPRSEARS